MYGLSLLQGYKPTQVAPQFAPGDLESTDFSYNSKLILLQEIAVRANCRPYAAY